MQISPSMLQANRVVLEHLQSASTITQRVQGALERTGSLSTYMQRQLSTALAHANDASAGVEQLGARNLLDGAFQRYTTHSTRHLESAVSMLGGHRALSTDARAILTQRLFDAEVATRLGSQAGARSLATPTLRTLEGSRGISSVGDDLVDSGPVHLDGEWIDSLGNPVRRSGEWAGPDGAAFDHNGYPVGGDSWAGPDGFSFAGI